MSKDKDHASKEYIEAENAIEGIRIMFDEYIRNATLYLESGERSDKKKFLRIGIDVSLALDDIREKLL